LSNARKKAVLKKHSGQSKFACFFVLEGIFAKCLAEFSQYMQYMIPLYNYFPFPVTTNRI